MGCISERSERCWGKKGIKSDSYKSLIINGHMDVAEVSADEAWETDPFDPFIKDGWLVGRGAKRYERWAGWSAICHSTFTRSWY